MIEIILTAFVGLPSCFATPIDSSDAVMHAVTTVTSSGHEYTQTLRFNISGIAKGHSVAYVCSGKDFDGKYVEQRGVAVAR